MEENPQRSLVVIEPESSESRITIEERGRKFVVHRVLTAELRSIGSFQNSVNLAFCMLTAGLGSGFVTSLILSHETMSDRKLYLFVSLSFASFLFSLYFGIRAWGDWQQAERKIRDIMNEGKETP